MTGGGVVAERTVTRRAGAEVEVDGGSVLGGSVVGRSDRDPSWLVRGAGAVAVRPRLWVTAVRQVGALAEPGWWRGRPPLPLPAPGYLRFRMVTAYGDPDARPAAEDVVAYLSWCRDEHRRLRSAGRRRRNRPVAARAGR